MKEFPLKIGKKTEVISILEPSDIFLGRPYGDWLGEWWNWLISPATQRENQTGPVHFLHGSVSYKAEGQPTIGELFKRIGQDREFVYSDQAILFPVINALADNKHFPGLDSSEKMRSDVRNDIRLGDYPPNKNQVKIDGKSLGDLDPYYAESPEFDLNVPDVGIYGSQMSSLKDALEVPLSQPGTCRAVTAGYWVFIKSLPVREDDQPYVLSFAARGRGTYVTGSYYEIEPLERKQSGPIRTLKLNGPDSKAVSQLRHEYLATG
jgi:hypothetical protein